MTEEERLAIEEARRAAEEARRIKAQQEYDRIQQMMERELSKPQDPEDLQRNQEWKKVEQDALARVRNGADPGLVAGLGAIAPLVAGLFDVAANKGRGLSNIAQTGVESANRLYQQQLAQQQDARQAAQQAHAVRRGISDEQFQRVAKLGTMFQENQRIAAQRDALNYRGDAAEQARQRFQNENSPTSAPAVAFREYIYSRAPNLKGTLDSMGLSAMRLAQKDFAAQFDHANADMTREDKSKEAAATAAASTAARLNTEHSLAPRTAQDAAEQAGLTTEATELVKGAHKTESEIADADRRWAPPEGREILNGEIAQAVKFNPVTSKQAQDDMRASARLVKAAEDLKDLRRKYGRLTALPSKEQARFESAKTAFTGMLAHATGMGSVQEGDRDAINQFLTTSGLSMTDLVTGNVKAEQLEGVLDTALKIDRDVAQTYGYTPYSGAAARKSIERQREEKRKREEAEAPVGSVQDRPYFKAPKSKPPTTQGSVDPFSKVGL